MHSAAVPWNVVLSTFAALSVNCAKDLPPAYPPLPFISRADSLSLLRARIAATLATEGPAHQTDTVRAAM